MPQAPPVISCYTEGDTLPLLRINLQRATGTTPDYGQYTVKLRLARANAAPSLEKLATLIDAPTGAFLIQWDPGDLLRGKHDAVVEITDGEMRRLSTRRLLFDVKEPLP